MERTGGPAVRFPSELYWPPWHGQPNDWARTGRSSTSPIFVIASSSIGPFGWTGQPRWTQRL